MTPLQRAQALMKECDPDEKVLSRKDDRDHWLNLFQRAIEAAERETAENIQDSVDVLVSEALTFKGELTNRLRALLFASGFRRQ